MSQSLVKTGCRGTIGRPAAWILWVIFLPQVLMAEEAVSSQDFWNETQPMADLKKEAEQGDAGAQYLLGFMYAEGQGLTQDTQEAIRWYTRAAEQGHPDAPLMLAAIYAEGQGVPEDVSEAIRWYRVAARQGQAGAQEILSHMLTEGEADLVEAYMWSVLAEQGGQNVTEIRKRLAERMTAEQIAQAQKQAEAGGCPLSAGTVETSPAKYVSLEDGFAVLFPSLPSRTVVQNNDRLVAVHYQSFSGDGQVQYNLCFQRFKKEKILEQKAQDEFLEDYLVTRAFLSWKNKMFKKSMLFQDLPAVRFKHTTFAEGKYTIHEGIIFFRQGDFVSLTCVYPSRLIPSPGFQEYLDSFEFAGSESPSRPG